jgi:hypothetical protein
LKIAREDFFSMLLGYIPSNCGGSCEEIKNAFGFNQRPLERLAEPIAEHRSL